MDRRSFFASFRAMAIAIYAAKGARLGWGYIDVKRHMLLRTQGIHLRVRIDGEDVTGRCFEADDQVGYVGLFKHRNGQAYVDYSTSPPEVAREWRHGQVECYRT